MPSVRVGCPNDFPIYFFSAHTRGVEIRYILSMRPGLYTYIYIL